MSFGVCKQSICLDDILSRISEVDILNYYFGISTLPILVNSPLRADKNASLSIFLNSNNNIILKDFGTYKNYNLWSFLMELWHLSYEDTLIKIQNDTINLVTTTNSLYRISNNKRTIHKDSKIEVTIRDWKDYDVNYWESYGISLPWLKFGRVYPISHIFINGDRFAAEKYAYVYIEKKDDISIKVYQPFSDRMKWLSKHDSSVWDLWDRLPETASKLIITSSRKDALCIWENTGIPSVSLQGEGYIPKEHVVSQLKNRFGQIFVLYDNDYTKDVNHGRLFGKTIADKFDLQQIEIPTMYESKDTSDLAFYWGRNTVKEVIKQLTE